MPEGLNENKSPFNPNDPKYQKVADLPEAVHKDYVDLPDGGFVRKTTKDTFDEQKQKKELSFLTDSKDRVRGGTWYSLKELGSMVFKRMFKGREAFRTRARESTRKDVVAAVKQNVLDRESDTFYGPRFQAIRENLTTQAQQELHVEYWTQMTDKLKEMGKTGFVVLDDRGHYMEGTVEGVPFNIRLDIKYDQAEETINPDDYMWAEIAGQKFERTRLRKNYGGDNKIEIVKGEPSAEDQIVIDMVRKYLPIAFSQAAYDREANFLVDKINDRLLEAHRFGTLEKERPAPGEGMRDWIRRKEEDIRRAIEESMRRRAEKDRIDSEQRAVNKQVEETQRAVEVAVIKEKVL